MTYEERLGAPVVWWLGALGVALLLAAGIHSGGDGARAVVPYVVLPAVAVAWLAQASRGRVAVVDGVLHVPGARIPVDALGGVTPLDRDATRQVRGPLAEPLAFVTTRPWLPASVRLQVEDPDDDTPYWLVGTRRPQELAAAVAAARDVSG
ncbi:MAG: DUF3093 domain-containing protein [Frankiales bacterium]|nr:MAG: DUF3093 domain-containing protein [Frankiales bacterium]